jgi:uncharacterized MAPEG superfamily protein
MTMELKYLVWTLILTLAQILLTATFRTRETGLAYNAGPRDTPSKAPIGKITGRLMRAEKNLFETLPVFIALVLTTQIADVHTSLVRDGVMLYFWSRLTYIPLYASGVSHVRSIVWAAGVVGLVMMIVALL